MRTGRTYSAPMGGQNARTIEEQTQLANQSDKLSDRLMNKVMKTPVVVGLDRTLKARAMGKSKRVVGQESSFYQ